MKTKTISLRIIDTGDDSTPYGLVEESTDTIVRLSHDPRQLAAWAFVHYGDEAEVRHEEDLIKAETIPWRK